MGVLLGNTGRRPVEQSLLPGLLFGANQNALVVLVPHRLHGGGAVWALAGSGEQVAGAKVANQLAPLVHNVSTLVVGHIAGFCLCNCVIKCYFDEDAK